MSARHPDADSETVLMPPGAPIREAAAWVGASCHLELVLHERIGSLLRSGRLPGRAIELWTVRAHRAELAAAWHRRLPELRELPRAPFVTPPPDVATAHPWVDSDGFDSRADVRAALDTLEDRYLQHLDRAVGPADGPVAETLVRALAVTVEDRLALT